MYFLLLLHMFILCSFSKREKSAFDYAIIGVPIGVCDTYNSNRLSLNAAISYRIIVDYLLVNV